MNVDVKMKKVKAKPEYPYLGIFDNGAIILFTGIGIGTCIADGGVHHVGEYGITWEEESATFFTGEINLSN